MKINYDIFQIISTNNANMIIICLKSNISKYMSNFRTKEREKERERERERRRMYICWL